MPSTIAILPPSLIGRAGIQFFGIKGTYKAQGAVFRRGDFLQNITTGTITQVNPQGSMAAITPTATATVTANGTVLAGAAKTVYYGYYTYAASSNESLPSAEFLIVNTPGYEATVTVPAAGAPAAATSWNLYVGLYPGTEVQQVTGTSLGSAATVPLPLTNWLGANRSITNANTNILGLAVDDYDVYYTEGQAAAFSNRSPFGADVSAPPMGFPEQFQSKYVLLTGGQTFEMSLLQAWTPSLQYSTAGIFYSTTYNTFAADTSQSNKILTIVGKVQGPTNPNFDNVGGYLDTGARVIVYVSTASALIGA